MKYPLIILILIGVLSISSVNVESETDCIIITSLDQHNFMYPAIVNNFTFSYNNFEFNLYSTNDNSTYFIEVNNITIGNGTIIKFHRVVTWRSQTEFIRLLSVRIDNDYYNYSFIQVFTRDITNTTDDDERSFLKFTKGELDNMINELKIKIFSADNFGWILGVLVAFKGSKELKKHQIIEVK